jgi:cytochrome P450
VLTHIGTVHADDRFHPEAQRFDGDRYLESKPPTYAWIPFGGGLRRCIGAAFAQFEMDVVIRTMLRHFELQPTESPAEAFGFRGVAYAPAKGGVAVVHRRNEPLGAGASAPAEEARCPVDHGALSTAGAGR